MDFKLCSNVQGVKKPHQVLYVDTILISLLRDTFFPKIWGKNVLWGNFNEAVKKHHQVLHVDYYIANFDNIT